MSHAARLSLRPTAADSASASTDSWATTSWRLQLAVGVGMAAVYVLALGADQNRVAMAVILASAAIAVLSPVAGLAMFTLIMPMREPEILTPIRANAIMAGAIGLGCVLRLPLDRLRLRAHPGIVLLLGYVAISAVTIPPAVSGHPPEWTSSALNELLRFTTGVALFVSASYLFTRIPSKAIIGLALLAATLAALLAIAEELAILPFPALTHGLLSDDAGSRASGGFSDPNYLGLYTAPALILALSMLAAVRKRWKPLLIIVVVLVTFSLLLTYSRGAYLGALVGIAVLIGIRSRVAALLLLGIAAILAVTLYPAFIEARLGDLPTANDAFNLLRSQNARGAVAEAGLAMFAASPAFGVGFGVFHFVSPAYTGGTAVSATYSHNQYLSIVAEQGLVGVVVVVLVVALTAYALWKSRSPLRSAAVAMGAAYLVLSFFINSTVSFQGSSIVWLVMAAALTPGPQRTANASEA